MEKIPTIRVEFLNLPDYILSEEDYNEMGGWRGFLRFNAINPRWVKKVHHILMESSNYPTSAWEG